MLRRLFLNTYLRAEAEAQGRGPAGRPRGLDLKAASVCVVVALSLTMINYLGDLGYALDALGRLGPAGAADRLKGGLTNFSNERLAGLIWWACVTVVFYFVVPASFIRLALGEPLSDYGLKLRGAFKDSGLYLLMFVVMLPVVVLVSGAAGFQAKYPFYQPGRGESLLPYFWQWEVFYFLQFFALEFFFRGFMVHGLKHRFGYYAVFVMTMPYCMIHFRKPFLEALAAIIAGVVLGTLSLKSRSILPGVAIHYGVAVVMDLAALWRKGLLW